MHIYFYLESFRYIFLSGKLQIKERERKRVRVCLLGHSPHAQLAVTCNQSALSAARRQRNFEENKVPIFSRIKLVLGFVLFSNRELTQQDGWKTREGRMMKKCNAILCIPNLTPCFFVFLPSWVFQSSSCVSSLLLESKKGKRLHRPIKLIPKRFRAL